MALEQAVHEEGPSASYASALKWSGEVELARPLYEHLRAAARAQGDVSVSIGILVYSAVHELLTENWEQAAGYADEARMLGIEAGLETALAYGYLASAYVAAYRGHVERARSDAGEARRAAAAVGLADAFHCSWPLGILDLSLGEHASALDHMRAVTQERLSTGLQEPGALFGFPEHVEAAVACGELEEAGGLLEWVESRARRLDRAWALGCCARGQALLASARGDHAAAEAAFARAYAQHARRPQQLPTYELARTLLLHGSILRRRQQKRQARDTLERALAIFGLLGALVYAERTRSELARIGGRALSAGDELSETERRIVALVVAGRRNREVAAELSLSPNTVAWNLSKVYRKLGVSSRTELAAHVSASPHG